MSDVEPFGLAWCAVAAVTMPAIYVDAVYQGVLTAATLTPGYTPTYLTAIWGGGLLVMTAFLALAIRQYRQTAGDDHE